MILNLESLASNVLAEIISSNSASVLHSSISVERADPAGSMPRVYWPDRRLKRRPELTETHSVSPVLRWESPQRWIVERPSREPADRETMFPSTWGGRGKGEGEQGGRRR